MVLLLSATSTLILYTVLVCTAGGFGDNSWEYLYNENLYSYCPVTIALYIIILYVMNCLLPLQHWTTVGASFEKKTLDLCIKKNITVYYILNLLFLKNNIIVSDFCSFPRSENCVCMFIELL